MRLKAAVVLLPLAAAAGKEGGSKTIKASAPNVGLQYNEPFRDIMCEAEIGVFKLNIEHLLKTCEDRSLKSIAGTLNAVPETSLEAPCRCANEAMGSLRIARGISDTIARKTLETSTFGIFKLCFQAPAERFILSLQPVLEDLRGRTNLISALRSFALRGDNAADMASTGVSLTKMLRTMFRALDVLDLEKVLDERIEAVAVHKKNFHGSK